MDEKRKQTYSSYRMDQEILDARGINMTVQEVVTLPTVKYSERVHSLNLSPDDLSFVKCLRRRIKNRLASQNSRKRSMEHLRRLTRELRVVRKCKGDAECERGALLEERSRLYEKCKKLREFLQKNINDKSPLPELPNYLDSSNESQRLTKMSETPKNDIETRLFNIFNERLEERIVCAKTFFLNHSDLSVKQSPIDDSLLVKQLNKPFKRCDDSLFEKSNALLIKQDHTQPVKQSEKPLNFNNSIIENATLNERQSKKNTSIFEKEQSIKQSDTLSIKQLQNGDTIEVLNLSVKQGRKSHGRKQIAPRRLVSVYNDTDDCVLDLKIKKEGQ